MAHTMRVRRALARGTLKATRWKLVGDVPRTGEPDETLAEPERLFAAKYQGGGDAGMFHDGRRFGAGASLRP